ncbi:MAG: radical SAM protein [Victivallaceae bacterium]|nr:radical SAM protein [Victivallaceae bacterium]
MDQIKRYIEIFIPVTTCNFRCHYCYITHNGSFKAQVPEFRYSPATVRKALSRERLGGGCLLNMCAAGETLIPEQIVEYIRELLEEGHYIMVVTNGSISKRFDQIVSMKPELLQRLIFKFSFHFLELERQGLFDRFFENIEKVRKAGCSFT